jgi:serine/threonine protein kinase
LLEVGQVVGGYQVERPIGAGAMGEVYKVRHIERGTVHALKYLPLPSRKVRQRLLREAEAQTRLQHANVVTLTEVIDVSGDPGLVMELVDGPSLDVWLEKNKPSLPEAEALFRGIVAGVAHAHRRGLVHRDLKPSNVLLARTGQGLVPKVADFGVAKVLDSSAPGGQSHLTRTGTSLGSPAYMAPEQIRDARSVGQAADLWSLGAILYELVCHERPFRGDDVLAVLNAAQSATYRPPRELRPDLPERFVRAIDACLKADPDDRLDSAEELLQILEDGGAATAAASPQRAVTPAGSASRGALPGNGAVRAETSSIAIVAGAALATAAALGAAVLILMWLL